MRWHPWCACPRGSSWKVLLCIGCLCSAVRSLERIITVIPKQKLSTVYFQMCNPWVVWQKKSVVQQYWELCVLWQPAAPGCAGGLPSWAWLTICPFCAAFPFLYPSFFCMLWGITFQCQYFFKGYGLSEVQVPDRCSPGDGPSQAGCEGTPLMEVFSPVHQRLISHGGQQESLGYCRVFHLMKFVQGTDTWLSCGRASWLHQWADT